ncbi:hypothetical protein EV2_041290 [Malus domestica]
MLDVVGDGGRAGVAGGGFFVVDVALGLFLQSHLEELVLVQVVAVARHCCGFCCYLDTISQFQTSDSEFLKNPEKL